MKKHLRLKKTVACFLGFLFIVSALSTLASASSDGTNISIQSWAINQVDNEPPVITDTTTGLAITGNPFDITATVIDNITLDSVNVSFFFSTTAGNTTVQNMPMNPLGGGNYSYSVMVPANTLVLYYNISANDTSNNWNWIGFTTLGVNDQILPEITDLTTGIPQTGSDYTITALVTDNIEVRNVSIIFQQLTTTGWTGWQNMSMNDIGGDNLNYAIPILDNSVELKYRIWANDTSDNWNSTVQVTLAVNDAIAPEIIDSSVGDPTTGQSFTVIAEIADNIAVDHVRLYAYFEITGGISTPHYYDMTPNGQTVYQFTITTLLNATAMDYNIFANDTNNNWNLTDVLSRNVVDDRSPTAYAEAPPVVNYGSMVKLNGTGSTDNIGIDNFTWTFTYAGMPVVLYGIAPEFTFLELGNHSITLNAADTYGNWDTYDFVVWVKDMEDPQADAGIDLFVNERGLVQFDGTGSTDNLGIVNYTWTFSYNGTTVTLYGAEPSFLFWVPGDYDITLRATDTAGQSNEDIVTVKVLNDPGLGGFPWWIPIILILTAIAGIGAFFALRGNKEEPVQQQLLSPPPPAAPPENAPEPGEPNLLEDIESRYREGHISEETYNMLKERYTRE